ncbi:putative aldouronate transport system substrate-binding protein [Paenibacillus sp. 1_12]|uniref:hypothetical protein n=1 Tax=Paenibacillus sp. 1_12 TaxID=1566278 RepID=UPI0008E6D726|nr:hypothetical protein [Paenibacillus sp. 1_12]SFL73116.1 putative aldouronate transport system substrate-binding protein [Paenibacillus sp. 1_12]
MNPKVMRHVGSWMSAAMLASTLAACSSGGNTPAPAAPATAPAAADKGATAQPKNEAPVTIEWAGYNINDVAPDPNAEILQEISKRFNAKINVWTADSQKYSEVFNVRMASGEIPDILRLKGFELAKLVDSGVAAEIPVETIKQKAPNYYKMILDNDTSGSAFRASMYKGKNYGLSAFQLDGTYPTSLVWRMDWLNNVGITKVPETLAEFEDAIYKFTNNDPDKNGKKDTYGLSSTAMQAVLGAFGPIPTDVIKGTTPYSALWYTVKDNKVLMDAIQPEMKEGLKLLAKWYKDGVIDPEFVTGENKGGYWATSHAFINNRVGVTGNVMFYHWTPPLTEGDLGGAVYQEFMKVKPDAKYGETWALGKAIKGPDGKAFGANIWGYNNETLVITKNAVKDPRKLDTILKMLDTLVTDKDYYMLASAGVKDKDYTVNKDGAVVSKLKNPTESAQRGVGTFGMYTNNPVVVKEIFKAKYELADKVKGTGTPPSYLPSVEASGKYTADMQKLTTENYIKIITGEQPIDSFDEYVKKARAAGANEIEKQYTDVIK